MPLVVHVEAPSADTLSVMWSGPLTARSARELRKALTRLIDGPHAHVELDLCSIADCDTTGLKALLDVAHHARRAGTSLTVLAGQQLYVLAEHYGVVQQLGLLTARPTPVVRVR